jgi:hypothetical protein
MCIFSINIIMRFYEILTKTLKPIKPLNPAQYRLYSLKRNSDSAKKAYKNEKDRQKVVKAQQQIYSTLIKN